MTACSKISLNFKVFHLSYLISIYWHKEMRLIQFFIWVAVTYTILFDSNLKGFDERVIRKYVNIYNPNFL